MGLEIIREKFKKRYLIILGIALLSVIFVVPYFLQKPNRIDPEGDHSFLLKTTWHQVGDYARFIPFDDDAGCWAAAISQIGHYHRLSPSGLVEYETSAGHQISIDLDSYDFEHSRFVAQIDDNTPDTAKEQIAKYVFFVSAVIYTDFGGHKYLEHQTFVERLESHLGCSVEFYEYDKAGFLREKDGIRSLVKREIDSSRPIMLYFDNGEDFGHASVIDGYTKVDSSFLVHLNMGWGGRHDGWYDLFHRFIGVRDDLQTRFLITIKPSH